jgi:6-phosphogluconate dehydrogenase
MKADIGVYGLGVMGANLALNFESKGYKVSVFNRTTEKVTNFMNKAEGKNFIPCLNVEEFIESLQKPAKIVLMIKAGDAIDQFTEQITPLLKSGDIIIDGGNSHYLDTERRCEELKKKNILFVGCGISGGETGALYGPSMMPGGEKEAWQHIEPILKDISAKTPDNQSCCEWIGSHGSGHFVKMVHNGIEYADMQAICEIYSIMKNILNMPNGEIAETFEEWNKGELSSYLIEITAKILKKKDNGNEYVVDKILDVAGQKGTGLWTGVASLQQGAAVPSITEAVYTRFISTLKDERISLSKHFPKTETKETNLTVNELKDALYATKLCIYAQGFDLLKSAEVKLGWKLDYKTIATVWKAGCIIRAELLDKIEKAFESSPNLKNLLIDPYFSETIKKDENGWRKTIIECIKDKISAPVLSSSLEYFDSITSETLPLNLLQAQRDFFGAHTYERIDKERGEFFHTNWE